MIDRSIAPALEKIKHIPFPKYEKRIMKNGINAYVINAGSQEVIKVELIFEAGRWNETKKAIASTAAALLKEGTSKHSALEVANIIDFYGASIQAQSFIDYSSITLYCLNKHLTALLPLLYELITEASYAESELNIYKQNSIQKLMVNEQKVEFIGQKKFTELLYGNQHPIGYTTSREDYDAMLTEDLINFRKQYFTSGNCKVIISGKVNDADWNNIENTIGSSAFNTFNSSKANHKAISSHDYSIVNEEKEGAVQSAIRVGKRFINKLHPDYCEVKTANLILGEYFGSRLMSNLREDKGFCYGVHSSIANFLNDAYFIVATEVGADVTAKAIKEIELELKRLQNDLVSMDELDSARSYRLGTILGDVDGPFNSADTLRQQILFGLDENYFKKYVDTLLEITPDQIRTAAQKYFDYSNMITIAAGAKI